MTKKTQAEVIAATYRFIDECRVEEERQKEINESFEGCKTYSLAKKETNMNFNYILPDENIDLHIKMATIALDKPGNFIVSPQQILAAFAEIKQSRARQRELEQSRSTNSVSIGTHPSLKVSVTVPHNVIGTYEDASGGRSDIVTRSDKREMKDGE